MAEATWDTLLRFGPENQVSYIRYTIYVTLTVTLQIMVFMTDNASNNNTLVEALVALAAKKYILLDAKLICLRCMPHTVHLAALKVSTHRVYCVLYYLCNIIPSFWKASAQYQVQTVRRQHRRLVTIRTL